MSCCPARRWPAAGNNRLLLFSHGILLQAGRDLRRRRGTAGLQQWFDPPYQLPQIDQGEITRQGDKLVTLAGSSSSGYSEEYVMLYAVRVRLRVRIPGSTVRVRLAAGTRLMGTAIKRRARAATLKLRVPLNRRGRAAIRRAHRLRLSVRVTVTPPNGTPRSPTRRVTLRR